MAKHRARKHPHHPRPHHIEEDAERFWTPWTDVELPDWLVGAHRK